MKNKWIRPLLMVLFVCFLLAGCGHSDPIYGKWTGSSVVMDGEEYTLSYLREHQDEDMACPLSVMHALENAGLTLTKSGNAVWNMPFSEGNTVECRFTLQDNVLELTDPSQPDEFLLLDYDGKSIRYDLNGYTFVFTK